MIENIVIREAVTEEERSLFWERLRAYFCRDIFPDPEDEDRPYFLGDDYRRTMESLHTRPVHPVHWLVFSRNGQDVGFALAVLLLLFVLHWFQYASLYIATYRESANRR